MARKTVYVSDLSNKQIPEGSGAKGWGSSNATRACVISSVPSAASG